MLVPWNFSLFCKFCKWYNHCETRKLWKFDLAETREILKLFHEFRVSQKSWNEFHRKLYAEQNSSYSCAWLTEFKKQTLQIVQDNILLWFSPCLYKMFLMVNFFYSQVSTIPANGVLGPLLYSQAANCSWTLHLCSKKSPAGSVDHYHFIVITSSLFIRSLKKYFKRCDKVMSSSSFSLNYI